LIFYCVAVLLFSMCGGYVPLVGRISHTKLQYYLSLSAGVMLGAAFFHVMPDALEKSGEFLFGCWISLSVLAMFFIERFIAPHTHEIDGGQLHPRERHEAHNHIHQPGHEHDHAHAIDPGRAAPAMAGWMAVLGLTIHTFMNGVGLGSAVQFDTTGSAVVWWPG